MTSLQTHPTSIFTGIVLLKKKIAEHTYHLKIQSQDFEQLQYIPGLILEIYLSNPYCHAQTEVQKYSFWDYEAIHHIADFAITFSSDSVEKEWIETVQEGDVLFFKRSSYQLFPDHTGDHYFLIGDSRALSYLYEVNRALSISKKITSLIYTEDKKEVYPDLDHSFPLNIGILDLFQPESILEYIQEYFPKDTSNTIAYIFGNYRIRSGVYTYFNDHPIFGIRNIYLNHF
ncbi:hypothetical protein EG347_03225 [Chryseobacterium sp. G0186]|uniref:hypothetical protein n=1 Tax=Chryseobacterium sp. G0186 TaxID=2487064 RepID=UPI000F4D6954|nr:hypothetical protein [Chryseobacterium sp. G0186]AZA76599.1 hypothetical protein EG347_03225 [Chryseobacterium sp. G0186]